MEYRDCNLALLSPKQNKKDCKLLQEAFLHKNLIMKDVLMCGLFFYFVQCLSELSHCIIEPSTCL